MRGTTTMKRRRSPVGLLSAAMFMLPAADSFQTLLLPFLARHRSGPVSSSGLWMKSPTASFGRYEWPEDLPSGDDGRHGSSSTQASDVYQFCMTETRKRRIQEEEDRKKRFLSGDALHQLRQQVLEMRSELQTARQLRAIDRVDQLEKAIVSAQALDPEFMYKVSMERMHAAQRNGLDEEAEHHLHEALFVKQAIPQFNLEGLWVGKYGDRFELINVTYVDDVLVARKVTGDRNVPKNEISFTVDLSLESPENSMLQPIELADDAAEQWGSRYLQRFAGRGQVSARGFVNSQWMDGQLIMVGNYFSFAWLPIGHQVFFGRPSAELTLKLLRESGTQKYQDDMARQHITQCMEETEMIQDEMEVSDGLFKSHDQAYYYDVHGAWE